MKTALTIAGSDSSGGAGIQADIKTMTVLGVYAMSVITSLTAQNTVGVSAISDTTPDFLSAQFDCVFTDIYPDAVKIGMVSSAELIKTIAEKLKKYEAKNIVLDPVMVATSGARLISDDAIDVLKTELIPLATILTPNIPEAEELSGMRIITHSDMKKAGEQICSRYGCSVLIKGGHTNFSADDFLCTSDGTEKWYCAKKIENKNTHGTGCTLSSAIAANLAKGENIPAAVAFSKAYLHGAIEYGLDLGKGRGPLAHNYKILERID